MIEAFRAYLAMLASVPSEGAALPALAQALARLTLAYHDIGGMAQDDSETAANPPRQEYQQLRDQAVRSFPELGYYHSPSSLSFEVEEEATLTLGDGMTT